MKQKEDAFKKKMMDTNSQGSADHGLRKSVTIKLNEELKEFKPLATNAFIQRDLEK